MKKISILGATGSIGKQVLEIISLFPQRFRIVGLSCGSNVIELKKIIRKFNPKIVSISDESKYGELKKEFGNKIKIYTGTEGLLEISRDDANLLVNALVGIIGLVPTLEAINSKKQIALANKEVLVCAGKIVMEEAKRNKVNIIPVDSEHSAIFQCLQGEDKRNLNKIILTCSGGPFLSYSHHQLKKVSVEETLSHPTWQMGKKISVDSATLMNKGFEIFEAMHLFEVNPDRIEVVIHPESVVHSLVEFVDGNIKADLSYPDMRIPISFALFYPERMNKNFSPLNLEGKILNFKKPDLKKFPCLKFAKVVAKKGGTLSVVLNTSDEIAVRLFLEKKIKFLDIPKIIELSLEKHKNKNNPNLKDILQTDEETRESLRRKL